ncbi:ATP-dependent zinc protease [Cyanobacterium stanieri LEGE 03274]|uniref:ATP-dependent zinc protease n=1 Tax=Cyanobacterium stanieri LEGE 03274 TaxID=1828756 RepID=A0ABR9V176_9CHRO|nr:RimK/LysX family protein [Cyanobacterium stanieri]MBE9221630.1 ATP-dependent zinc protease [Cyanobacterium stanieri LEGE 03274]
MNTSKNQSLPLIGWREYLALPTLGVTKIKAKIDTGAKTSALHAFNVKIVEKDNQNIVEFEIHPIQKDNQTSIFTTAPLLEYRTVKNSGGIAETRPVIETKIILGNISWAIALTLTNRDSMGFRMLLGRDAVKNRFLVDTGNSFLHHSIT